MVLGQPETGSSRSGGRGRPSRGARRRCRRRMCGHSVDRGLLRAASVGAERSHPPEAQRRAEPVERQDLASDERLEQGRAVGRRLGVGRDRAARPRTARGRTSSSRRTGPADASPMPTQRGSIGPKRHGRPGREAVREMQPVRARQEARDRVRVDHRPESTSVRVPSPRSTARALPSTTMAVRTSAGILLYRRVGRPDGRARGAARAPGRTVFRQARPG